MKKLLLNIILSLVSFTSNLLSNDFLLAYESLEKGDIVKAKELNNKLCDKNNFINCGVLGNLYEKESNFSKAISLYDKACKGGFSLACNSLGYLYKNGKGIEKNFDKAKENYLKACDNADSKGCYNIALM